MGINASQPLLVSDSRLFLSSSYGMGAAVIEITRNKSTFGVREVWRNTRMKNRFTSSVLHEGFIYGLDEAILTCIDAATGEPKWKAGRYGYGQIVLASGHIIVLTEDGDLALVRATPAKHEQISRFPVLEGKTWNHPALADGYLLDPESSGDGRVRSAAEGGHAVGSQARGPKAQGPRPKARGRRTTQAKGRRGPEPQPEATAHDPAQSTTSTRA